MKSKTLRVKITFIFTNRPDAKWSAENKFNDWSQLAQTIVHNEKAYGWKVLNVEIIGNKDK